MVALGGSIASGSRLLRAERKAWGMTMSERAARFFEVWVSKNLDYEHGPETAAGTPAQKASALIAEAYAEGISEQELSEALAGNVRGAVFIAMMKASEPPSVEDETGPS